jgi:hypothetical protein
MKSLQRINFDHIESLNLLDLKAQKKNINYKRFFDIPLSFEEKIASRIQQERMHITHNVSKSHNLFSIKAGGSWTGKTVDVTTTEYVNGAPVKRVEKFRAYDSYEESFRDYARLIKESPRYEKAESVAKTGSAVAYAAALQKAGYATDPEYARKLSGAIQSALRAMA